MQPVQKNQSIKNNNLKLAFLKEWPISRLKIMQIDDYTNIERKSSFCYWLESLTNDLGSIWGGSAYKFGIFRIADEKKDDERTSYKNDGKYKWVAKYGNSAAEAFERIKLLIVDVAEASKNNKLNLIDNIDLGEAYKWKIAFLYSDFEVINIYKPGALRYIAEIKGYQKHGLATLSSIHQYLISIKSPNEDYYEYTQQLWLLYRNQNSEIKPRSTNMNSKFAELNTILYGPPGTGKTYTTVEKALAIADPEYYANNKEHRVSLRKRFNELLIDFEKPEGQIAFITFHQSMSYEDFIEGIKPKLDGDNLLKYEIKDGIFKKMAERATANKEYSQLDKKQFIIPVNNLSKTSFYKISLGDSTKPEDREIYEYCIENGYIAIGFGEGEDFSNKSEKDVIEMTKAGKLGRFAGQAINTFKNYIKKDNYVLVSNGNYRVRAIGKVLGDYEFKPDAEIPYNQFRKVEWLVKDVDIPIGEIYGKILSQQTIYKLHTDWIKSDFFIKENSAKKEEKETQNFVLIIDEINRGNVSQIFGELITLIEEDKRMGNNEAFKVTLPYSQSTFSVPSNLYIIGTMNTADRSVEALDTALRRRFSFEEMIPQPELLSPESMINHLFWSHRDKVWEDKTYKQKEQALFDFLQVPDGFDKLKYDVWKSMEDTGIATDTSDLFKGLEFTGINLQTLLESMNNRIEVLLSRDYQIGHAFFMGLYDSEDPLGDLRMIFKDKIIPLLQEYFYSDYGKIGLVLGSEFVTIKKNQSGENGSFFANFEPAKEIESELLEKQVYHIKKINEMDDPNFIAAIKSIYINSKDATN